MISFIQKSLLKLPYVGRKLKILDDCGYLPGHYYSPIPNLEEIRNRRATIFKRSGIDPKGIELRKEEQFALVNQLRRAVISVCSNIAEGAARKTKPDRRRFYEIARSSLVEIDTQMEAALLLNYANKS